VFVRTKTVDCIDLNCSWTLHRKLSTNYEEDSADASPHDLNDASTWQDRTIIFKF